MSELPEWQKQFQAWYDSHYKGKFQSAFEKDCGVSRGTWSCYLTDRVIDLTKLARHVKKKLYDATKLDCFKVDDVRYGRVSTGKKAPLHDWQLKLIDHIEGKYQDVFDFCRKTGLNYTSVRRLVEIVRPFNVLEKRTRDLLYKATGIELFKCQERYTGKTYSGKTVPLNSWQVELIGYLDRNNLKPKKACEKSGIKMGTFRGYLTKVMYLDSVSEKNKARLYKLTGLETFNVNGSEVAQAPVSVAPAVIPQSVKTSDPGSDIGFLVEKVGELQKQLLERLPMPSAGEGDLVKQTANLFYALAGKLEAFKSSAELRETLTKKLSKGDVGRMTSLLHAIYKSKDDFDQWMLISGYSYKGGN